MGKSDYKFKTVTSVLTERVQAMCDDRLATMHPDGGVVYKAYSYSVGMLIMGIGFVYISIQVFIYDNAGLSAETIFGGIVFGLVGIAFAIRALHRGELVIDTGGIAVVRNMFGLKHEKFLCIDSIDSVDVVHKGELENSGQDVFALHLILKSGKRYRWLSCSGSEYDMNMVRDIILCYKNPSAGSEAELE